MGYIYKISNTNNDKLYIGKTCTTIANRWAHHKNAYLIYDWHLYRAMRKYGIESFSIEVIEQCEDAMLNEREIYWINYYDSINNGYNMTIGGDGRTQLDRNIICFEWNNNKSVKEIADLLGCWPSTVADILKEQNLYDAKEVTKRKQKTSAKSQTLHRVIQYDEMGNIIHIYNSAMEAAQAVNTTNDSIQSAITSGGSRMGYFWGRENEKLPNFHKIIRPKIRKIEQLDLFGNVINTFNNAAEAARFNNFASASTILKVCKGERKTAYKYKWRYCDESTD